MTVQEHLDYLKLPILQSKQHVKRRIMLLNSLFKVISENYGITSNDNIYRIKHRATRNQIISDFKSEPQVRESMR